jgi:uncharacterized membrane protein YqjE
MEPTPESAPDLASATKRISQRLFIIAENRLQLLIVEAQEERERILQAMCLAIATAAFGLLTGVTLTLAIVVVLWNHSPVLAVLVLAVIYLAAALAFYLRLVHMQKNWQTLPSTLEQLRKDRECLEKSLI